MSSISGQHHSFDILIAAKYGVEEAILIHHFMHWIRINQMAKRNIRDGRCWTYQSRKEIALHFPYWNDEKIRTMGDKLVEMGVLLKGNYNKSAFDKTLWYAFVNEKEFGVDPESSNKFFEIQEIITKGKFPKSTVKIPNGCGKIPTPIPDILIPDSINTDERGGGSIVFPSSSADAEALSDFFINSLKDRIPKFISPDKKKWAKEMELILKTDGRDIERTKELITWASTHRWWKKGCQCPSKLRKSYSEMNNQFETENLEKAENQRITANLKWSHKAKKEFLFLKDCCKIFSRSVLNTNTQKDISLDIGEEDFKIEFKQLFEAEHGRYKQGF